MFSLKKSKKIYFSPRTSVCEMDLESSCLLTGSEMLTPIQADELDNKAAAGEDGLGRGTSSYIEI